MNAFGSSLFHARFRSAAVGAGRWVCGGVLLTSGAAHVGNPYFFLSVVLHYDLVHGTPAVVVAAVVPFIEIGLGAVLIVGACIASALGATSALMGVFAFAQCVSLARGLEITCGCFGIQASEVIGPMSLARTVGFMATAAVGAAAATTSREGPITARAARVE